MDPEDQYLLGGLTDCTLAEEDRYLEDWARYDLRPKRDEHLTFQEWQAKQDF